MNLKGSSGSCTIDSACDIEYQDAKIKPQHVVPTNRFFFYWSIFTSTMTRIFWATFDMSLTVGSAVRIFLNSFFYFLTHIFDEKKSAQIRLKIAPIARTTSRAGQIWPQIIFLIFWKIQYLEPRVAPVCDPVPCPWNAMTMAMTTNGSWSVHCWATQRNMVV